MHENESRGVRLYPNPARDRISVQGFTSGTGITIRDAVGRIQWQGIAVGEHFQVEVGHWARGLYVLHAANAGRREAFKFVLVE